MKTAQPNKENVQVNIAVKKIKELGFIIDENVEFDNRAQVHIGFELNTNINPSESTVEVLLTATFTKQKKEVLMQIKVSNTFKVKELAQLHDPKSDNYRIPDNVLVTFLSLSISHTRALLAKNALGTKFSDLYIPIVNPVDAFNHLMKKQSH